VVVQVLHVDQLAAVRLHTADLAVVQVLQVAVQAVHVQVDVVRLLNAQSLNTTRRFLRSVA
jgi:hypothetical protein